MNILLWILQILLGLLFIFSGVTKFLMPYEVMIEGAKIVFPHWFLLFIGVCEILGGIGLIVPWATGIKPGLTPLAAVLLVVIMAGAVVSTALMSVPMAIVPLVVGLLLIVIARGRRSSAATG
jgi:uncharacterized membrane protein YphA (DoxX/SURF4 family)